MPERSLFQRLIESISERTGRPADPGPPAARFNEQIEVSAEPTGRRPTSEQQALIHLGSATTPPSGTYMPPDVPATTTRLDDAPNLAAAWQRMRTAYPQVARYANVETDPTLTGSNVLGRVNATSSRTIRVNPTMEYLRPEMQDDTLRHELVHVANGLNTLHGLSDVSRPISEDAAEWTQLADTPKLADMLRALDEHRAAERLRQTMQSMAIGGLRNGGSR